MESDPTVPSLPEPASPSGADFGEESRAAAAPPSKVEASGLSGPSSPPSPAARPAEGRPAGRGGPQGQPQRQQLGRGPRHPGGGPRQEGPRQEGPDRRGPQRPQYQSWPRLDFLARAVREGIDREFLKDAAEFARWVGPGLGFPQLRSVFGEVARQEMSGLDPARLLLLKPRMAYLAARAGRGEMRDFRGVLERAVDAVSPDGGAGHEGQARLDRLSQGLEAILSYGKVHERRQGERG